MGQYLEFIQEHPLLSFGWVGLLIVVIFLTVKGWMSKVIEISSSKLVELINKEEAIVVDVRSQNNFKQGHITDAYNILPIDIKNGSLTVINKFKDHPVIVVCDNGTLAAKPAADLVKAGFSQVYVLKEGITGWNHNNLPLIKGK